jgi:hypothetical protein
LSIHSLPANYIRAMPSIDAELTAVTAAKFPHAPRLDLLRSALAKLDPAAALKRVPEG